MNPPLSAEAYMIPSQQNTLIVQSTQKSNTFVHKLFNMVIDNQFQHLIAWNYTGSSFIVCNIMEFSRDVLPKHFKHNNFSSFVRQLNMYGFHKVNKSPRGHRTLAENQIWEFSHTKFLRDRPDLLDEIKRKTMESDTVRRETDLQAHIAMLQVSQTDMLQQINHLYDNFSQVFKELHETKQKQEQQQKLVKHAMEYIAQQNGGRLPQELDLEYKKLNLDDSNKHHITPPIFVTTHHTPTTQPATHQPLILTQARPSFGNTLPPSPSPTMLFSSEGENNSYFSNNSMQRHSQLVGLHNILTSPTPTRATINNTQPSNLGPNMMNG